MKKKQQRMHTVALGLGSNVGERARNLELAIAEIKPLLSGVRLSQIYESAALLAEGAPSEWDLPFLNMVVVGETAFTPRELLQQTQKIEKLIGRVPRGHWAPREIDIDILLYDNLVVADADLQIPHPQLPRREFVLLPLAELLPQWRFPQAGEWQGMTVEAMAGVKGKGKVKGMI